MSEILKRVQGLIEQNEILISEHGYDELAADNLTVNDLLTNVFEGIVVEEYPEYHKGPCVLVLQKDGAGNPVHVLWGIPAGAVSPAVVITAYRPDAKRWTADFMRRLT